MARFHVWTHPKMGLKKKQYFAQLDCRHSYGRSNQHIPVWYLNSYLDWNLLSIVGHRVDWIWVPRTYLTVPVLGTSPQGQKEHPGVPDHYERSGLGCMVGLRTVNLLQWSSYQVRRGEQHHHVGYVNLPTDGHFKISTICYRNLRSWCYFSAQRP